MSSSEKFTIEDAGALFQIAEPNQGPAKKKRKPGRAVGIDLGTTHSLVAWAPRGSNAEVLEGVDPARLDSPLLPSVVSYVGDLPMVGRAARAQAVEFPTQVISSVKRFMGRGGREIDFSHPYRFAEGDEDEAIRIDVGNRQVSPVEVSAEILRALKKHALARIEKDDGEPTDEPIGAVITVPAYFDDAQRQATKDAGRIAGFEVYRLLAEPTAAALAYGLDRKEQGLFAVYDLGGGTFDISILELRDGVFRVLATGGDSELGGDDFDRALLKCFFEIAQLSEASPKQIEEGLQEARRVKEALSSEQETPFSLEHSGVSGQKITRESFDALIRPLVQKTLKAARQTIKDADIDKDELDGVILVGGSTRVPLVRSMVAQAFGQEPLSDIDPDRVVAYGAAIQADVLSGSEREGVTLLDVVPLSLGLETMGGIVESVIPRNSSIPIQAKQVFTNYSEKQTGMSIRVVQGEREMAKDCRSLANFELKGIPALPPSMARIEVTFELDADALLTVTARELMTGVKQSVQVKAAFGLEETEIQKLIADSYDHAEDDFSARNQAEARVELGRVVLAVRTALLEVGHLPELLSAAGREEIEVALKQSDEAMQDIALDADEIRKQRESLERVSEGFARRRMERALASGMSGKSLAEIEETLAEHENHESSSA